VSTDLTPRGEEERARAAAEALARLERRAAETGVTPFDSAEWGAESDHGETPEEVRREVDEFLSLVRECRDTRSSRGLA
jgi:hypothetical protein